MVTRKQLTDIVSLAKNLQNTKLQIEGMLNKMSEEEVGFVLSVYYGGRQHDTDGTIYNLLETWEDRKGDKKDAIIRQILEKSPLADYLQRGIDIYHL